MLGVYAGGEVASVAESELGDCPALYNDTRHVGPGISAPPMNI